jgi:UDP-N-acetylmuramoylalanine--D-glutamate ligase
VEYINDSKATNVEATYFALEAMKKPVHWIVGGVDKGNDYSSLIPFVQQKVKSILCLGKDNQKIVDVFGDIIPNIHECLSAKDVVQKAAEIATDGEVVLLSPCCASFDLFKNYEDRGDQFKKEINLLK